MWSLTVWREMHISGGDLFGRSTARRRVKSGIVLDDMDKRIVRVPQRNGGRRTPRSTAPSTSLSP
jgi:hypothetical protein